MEVAAPGLSFCFWLGPQHAVVAPTRHRAAGAAGCVDGSAKQTQSEALAVQTAAGITQKGFAALGFAALGLPCAAAQAQLLRSGSGCVSQLEELLS